jgi:hypothetical protein
LCPRPHATARRDTICISCPTNHVFIANFCGGQRRRYRRRWLLFSASPASRTRPGDLPKTEVQRARREALIHAPRWRGGLVASAARDHRFVGQPRPKREALWLLLYGRSEQVDNMLPVICPNARRFWAMFAACSDRTRQMLDHQNCWKALYFRGLEWWRTQSDASQSPRLVIQIAPNSLLIHFFSRFS